MVMPYDEFEEVRKDVIYILDIYTLSANALGDSEVY